MPDLLPQQPTGGSPVGMTRMGSTEDPQNRNLQGKERSFMSFGFSAEAANAAAAAKDPSRRESHIAVNVAPTVAVGHDMTSDTPEIRKYKKRFNSEILCAALWGVNLLIGTENGLMLLDRSGQGKVYQLVIVCHFYTYINLLTFDLPSTRYLVGASNKWRFWKVRTFWSLSAGKRTA